MFKFCIFYLLFHYLHCLTKKKINHIFIIGQNIREFKIFGTLGRNWKPGVWLTRNPFYTGSFNSEKWFRRRGGVHYDSLTVLPYDMVSAPEKKITGSEKRKFLFFLFNLFNYIFRLLNQTIFALKGMIT